MTSEQRARIQAETDVLVGSCHAAAVDARALVYLRLDLQHAENVERDPRCAQWPGLAEVPR